MIHIQYILVWYIYSTSLYDTYTVHPCMIHIQYILVWYIYSTSLYDTYTVHPCMIHIQYILVWYIYSTSLYDTYTVHPCYNTWPVDWAISGPRNEGCVQKLVRRQRYHSSDNAYTLKPVYVLEVQGSWINILIYKKFDTCITEFAFEFLFCMSNINTLNLPMFLHTLLAKFVALILLLIDH